MSNLANAVMISVIAHCSKPLFGTVVAFAHLMEEKSPTFHASLPLQREHTITIGRVLIRIGRVASIIPIDV